MKMNYAVLAVLFASLLVACNNGEDIPAKSDNGSPTPPTSAGREGMPAVAIKNTCDACHTIKTKKVGPSWMDVAKKYKGDPEAVARLSAKIRKGGAGVWGAMPMPPNVAPSDAEVKELVDFILGLSK
jgi:cytochrome c